MKSHSVRFSIVILVTSTFVGLGANKAFSTDMMKVQGFVKARNGDVMVVQTPESPNLDILLTDATKVGQVEGVLKARRKEMSMAALIPGLAVKVEGTYNGQNQLVATAVSFKGNDLQRAQSIQAGMHETQAKAQENREELERHQETIAAQQSELAKNKASIDAAVARFGQLDDYYILDEVTVYFANGKSVVDPQYMAQLDALAQKATAVNGYMIEVKGFTSSSGSTELNQQLSEDRADRVSNILIQQGHIPLTRMLAPGAMGESHQIGNQDTEQGEAANRRVVVRVLQNKAMAGV